MEQFTRSAESDGWSTDLRIIRRSDGTVTVQNLKDQTQSETYGDMDECAEHFSDLLRHQNPSS